MADRLISRRPDAKHGNLHASKNLAGTTHHDYVNSSPGGHLMEAQLKKTWQLFPRPSDRPVSAVDRLNLADKVEYTMSHGTSRYTREPNPFAEHKRFKRLANILDSQTLDGDLRGIARPFEPPQPGNPARLLRGIRRPGTRPMKAVTKS